MSDHSDHSRNGVTDWIFSRTGVATVVAISIMGFLIYTGHSAHLFGALPFLLILACPLMHIFMHGGHGSHHDHSGDKGRADDGMDQTDRPAEAPPTQHQH